MVAKGLPDAEQRILADASKYIEEWEKVRKEDKTSIASQKELAASLDNTEKAIKKVEKSVQDVAKQYEKMEKQKEYIRSFVEMEKAVDAAFEANKRFNDNPIEIEDHTHLIEEATKAYRDHAGMTDFLNEATTRQIKQTLAADEATTIHIATTNELIAARQKAAQVTRDLAAAHQEASAAMLGAEAISRRAVSDGLTMIRTSNLPSGGTGAAFAAGGGGGEPAGSVAMRALKTIEDNNRFMSILPGLLAGGGIAALGGLFAMGRSGGGRGIGGAIGAGIGDLGGAIGGAMAGGPTAADTSRVVTGFMRRWYPAAHWALMLTNELLATVGPAVAAGGMGALTAAQGFEQLIPRGRASFNAAESLGPSLGMTLGQAWGLKQGQLQTAQDMATGLATQLAGGGVNMLKAGAGSPFVQLGLNTDAMVARFWASLTQRFQQGGLGGKLGNLVTGGTGYLQQFGDVLANLGNAFLNTAPNLPGVGSDLLSTLSGATGVLSRGTGWLGGMLGPILAGEAGMRWGPAIVGTAGRSIAGLGNILGNAGRGGLLSRIGLGTGTEGGLAGIGAALGGLSAPEIGAIAAGALYLNKAYTYQTPQQVAANQQLAQIGQMGFVPGYMASITAMQQLSGTAPGGSLMAGASLGNIGGGLMAMDRGLDIRHLNPSQIWGGAVRMGHGLLQMGQQIMGGGVAADLTPYEVNQAAITKLAGSMVNALNAGGQIQDQWKKLSGQAIDMGKATDVATMAQLQLGTAFQKNGQLSPQAQQMIANLYAGYAPMHMNQGMFGAAVGAQTAMSGLQHTQVAAVNQAYDQLTQLVTGGGATASTFFGLLGGTPTTFRRGGVQFAQAPALSAMSQALQSFVTPTGAAAWNRLTNAQTGMFPALQGQLDWLRQAQVMNALTPGQTTGMASFEMAQMLPMLKGSPAGLAMLSTYAQQFGGPGFAPGTSASAMFKGLSRFFGSTGVGAGGYNRLMTLGTEGMANIGTDANQFVQNIGQGIGGAMSAAVFSRGEDLMKTFMGVAGHKGSAGALGNLASFMYGSGTPLAGAQAMVKVAATDAGASQQSISAMMGQLKTQYVKLKVEADTASARAAIANLTHVSNQPKVSVKADVAAAQAAINAIKGKDIPVSVRAQGIAAVESAIAGIHGKNVTVTITTINRMITQLIGATGAPGGVAPATLVGSGGRRFTTGQTGMRVPGWGGGDIFPAMLEPGELVVPKHLVSSVAPILGGKIPGFQAGGGFGVGGFEAMLNAAFHGDSVQTTLKQILDQLISATIASHSSMLMVHPFGRPDWGTGGGSTGGQLPTISQAAAQVMQAFQTARANQAGQQFSVEVLKGLRDGMKNAGPAAKAAAQALMTKISQEIGYAKSTTATMMAGLNFGGMNVDPATGSGPVATQMQSYAASLKAFSADIKAMTKGGLNKDLLKQMIAAGPVQGDALAQSISQGPGGIGAVNSLYAQIQKLSKGIGAQAASSIYGGTLAPNLKSGTFITNNVSVSISGGAGGGIGSIDTMTPKQLNQLMALIQRELLKQAKRNRHTGVAIKGKPA